jgi:hypothetical protein
VPYVVGALGSRPTASKGIGRSRSANGGAGREPKGTRHAVDTDTGRPACGTVDALRLFADTPWSAEGEWCPDCADLVPFV